MQRKGKNDNYMFRYLSNQQLASLSVRDIGFQSCAKDHSFGPCIRNYYIIHYVISGSGYCVMNGKKFHIHTGEAFLIYQNTTALYYSDMDDPWEYYWIGFSGNDAKFILELTDFTTDLPVFALPANRILKLFLDIYNIRGEDSLSTLRMTGYLYFLLSHFIENSHNNVSSLESAMKQNLHIAEQYILQNYQNAFSIEKLAQESGISRSWLYRCFKELTGMSPKEYLTSYRIERATILLQNSNYPIKKISYLSGFQDELYFSKVYKKATGRAPSECRRKCN